MSIFDILISKIAPHDCLACGAEGYLLCAACAAKLRAAGAARIDAVVFARPETRPI
jgi:hypothetical protein